MLHYPDGRRSFNRPEDCRRPLPGDDLACFWICINGRDSRRPGAARLTHQRYKMKIDRMMKAAANKIKRILLPCEFDGGLSMTVSLRGAAISFREQAEWKQKKKSYNSLQMYNRASYSIFLLICLEQIARQKHHTFAAYYDRKRPFCNNSSVLSLTRDICCCQFRIMKLCPHETA